MKRQIRFAEAEGHGRKRGNAPPALPGVIKRSKIKAMRNGALKDLLIAVEQTEAQILARVEHPFHAINNLFGHRKVRYKGLVKNTALLFSLFGLANLALARKRLLASQGNIRPGREKCAGKLRRGQMPT